MQKDHRSWLLFFYRNALLVDIDLLLALFVEEGLFCDVLLRLFGL